MKSSLANSGKLVKLLEFGGPKAEPKRLVIKGTFNDFLLDATELLKLTMKVKYVYTEEGEQIKSLEDIKDGAVLLVSPRDQKSKLQNSPGKSPRLNSSKIPTPKGKRTPQSTPEKTATPDKSIQSTPPINLSKTSPKLQKSTPQKETKFSPEKSLIPEVKESPYVRYHQLLITLPGTADDHLLYSMLSSYTSLSQSQRKLASDYDKLEDIYRNTQYRLFSQLLESELICTVQADSIVNEQITQRCLEYLDEKQLDDIKYAIIGPPHCGKTSVLYNISLILYRKLQLSDDNDTVFMFPYNIQKHLRDVNDPIEFYLSFARVLTDCLLFSRFQCWNCFLQIREWFFSIPTIGTLPQLTEMITKNPFIDSERMKALGKRLHNLFRKQNSIEVTQFQKEILGLPVEFAQIFGYQKVCFLLDHVKNISSSFSQSLAEGISKMPFIIAAIEDENFKQAFKKRSSPIYPDDFCQINEKRSIRINNTIIDTTDCNGFPSYIHSYCDILNTMESIQTVKKQLGGYTPTVNKHKENLVRQKLCLLCENLYLSGNKKITTDLLNDLSEPGVSITLV